MKKHYLPLLLFLSALVGFLTALLCKVKIVCCQEKPEPQPYNTIVDRVKKLLRDNANNQEYSGEILLEQLGEPRDIVESNFNKSVELVLEEFRVNQAETLLRETDDTISCIAETVGFGNSSALYRPFKKQFELSPSQYREKMRG